VEWQRTGGAPWNCIFFYGCTWFFALLYSVAWRTGTVVRRLAAMLLTIGMLLFLAWYHGDQSGVRQDYSAPPGVATSDSLPAAGELLLIQHPPAPWLAISVAADLLAATALLAHGLYMGWGYRARKRAKGEDIPILPRSAARFTQGIRLFESDGTEDAIGDQELLSSPPSAAELEAAVLERMRADILTLRAQTGEQAAEPNEQVASAEVWTEVQPSELVAAEEADTSPDDDPKRS
jgi:hypothetical protein